MNTTEQQVITAGMIDEPMVQKESKKKAPKKEAPKKEAPKKEAPKKEAPKKTPKEPKKEAPKKAPKEPKEKKAPAPKKVKAKVIKEDLYTKEVLDKRWGLYREKALATDELIQATGLPIRHENTPEDITENMAKFIIRNHDGDESCKWAKCIGAIGDVSSDKYPSPRPPEIKSFTSSGPSSFGPKKKFGVIYFLDLQGWKKNIIALWKANITDESTEWKNIKINKNNTLESQCKAGRRPHIGWENIYPQIQQLCTKVFEGTYEEIFTKP